jgi:hypothetical protein
MLAIKFYSTFVYSTCTMYTVNQLTEESSSHVWLVGWKGVRGGPACVGWPRIKRSLYFLELFYNQNCNNPALEATFHNF